MTKPGESKGQMGSATHSWRIAATLLLCGGALFGATSSSSVNKVFNDARAAAESRGEGSSPPPGSVVMSFSLLPLSSDFRRTPGAAAGTVNLPVVHASIPFGGESVPAAETVEWVHIDRKAPIHVATSYRPKAAYIVQHDAVSPTGVPVREDPDVSRCNVTSNDDATTPCTLHSSTDEWRLDLDDVAFFAPGYYILQLEWSVRADASKFDLDDASASYAFSLS